MAKFNKINLFNSWFCSSASCIYQRSKETYQFSNSKREENYSKMIEIQGGWEVIWRIASNHIKLKGNMSLNIVKPVIMFTNCTKKRILEEYQLSQFNTFLLKSNGRTMHFIKYPFKQEKSRWVILAGAKRGLKRTGCSVNWSKLEQSQLRNLITTKPEG